MRDHPRLAALLVAAALLCVSQGAAHGQLFHPPTPLAPLDGDTWAVYASLIGLSEAQINATNDLRRTLADDTLTIRDRVADVLDEVLAKSRAPYLPPSPGVQELNDRFHAAFVEQVTLEETFFAQVSELLTDAQQPRLELVRRMRERMRLMNHPALTLWLLHRHDPAEVLIRVTDPDIPEAIFDSILTHESRSVTLLSRMLDRSRTMFRRWNALPVEDPPLSQAELRRRWAALAENTWPTVVEFSEADPRLVDTVLPMLGEESQHRFMSRWVTTSTGMAPPPPMPIDQLRERLLLTREFADLDRQANLAGLQRTHLHPEDNELDEQIRQLVAEAAKSGFQAGEIDRQAREAAAAKPLIRPRGLVFATTDTDVTHSFMPRLIDEADLDHWATALSFTDTERDLASVLLADYERSLTEALAELHLDDVVVQTKVETGWMVDPAQSTPPDELPAIEAVGRRGLEGIRDADERFLDDLVTALPRLTERELPLLRLTRAWDRSLWGVRSIRGMVLSSIGTTNQLAVLLSCNEWGGLNDELANVLAEQGDSLLQRIDRLYEARWDEWRASAVFGGLRATPRPPESDAEARRLHDEKYVSSMRAETDTNRAVFQARRELLAFLDTWTTGVAAALGEREGRLFIRDVNRALYPLAYGTQIQMETMIDAALSQPDLSLRRRQIIEEAAISFHESNAALIEQCMKIIRDTEAMIGTREDTRDRRGELNERMKNVMLRQQELFGGTREKLEAG